MHKDQDPNLSSVPRDGTGAPLADAGRDDATVALAYEMARHSFCWDPTLTVGDHERFIVGLLWSIGDRELSAQEWTERMEALQEEALREKRASATLLEDRSGGADE